MKDWIPLLQSLVWPAFLGLLVIFFRRSVRAALNAIIDRVASGDDVEFGPAKFHREKLPHQPADSKLAEKNEVPHLIFILHKSRRAPRFDRNGLEYYRIRMWIDADDPASLNGILAVTYHLHPEFDFPTQKSQNRDDNFAIMRPAYGEFGMWAEITFKDGADPIRIERYINL